MEQRTIGSGYENLVDRLNRFPQGAPPSKTLYQILQLLFDEHEAQMVSLLPIKPFTAGKAARAWRVSEKEARKLLDSLASRAILLDVSRGDESVYVLPPPMAGFFEFSMMRIRGDVDQKALGQLFYQYMNVEEDFIKDLFLDGETQLGRVFINETVLPSGEGLYVLPYERASEVVKTASHIGVGTCYCRHKMMHAHTACDAPLDICMTFNGSAAALIDNGFARQVDAAECLELLDQAYEHNLVQFGENVQKGVNFICNCCGCCCEALVAARKFGFLKPVHTSNFLPKLAVENCTGCGKCVSVCPVEALSLISANDPARKNRKVAAINEDLCLGCGVCVRSCPTNALNLEQRPERVITPVNSTHRVVLMAIERGKLQNLIFDNHYHFSHRAMASVLGVILKLPPVKQLMASEQMKSRYLTTLIERYERRRA
ncbi:MAG: 4Fe-4S binding protein [Spirochaetaceae bacterium]|nr:4Fe-4S binding protein [Spirochaetaceae bacterium]MCF7947939.1 4Fe-4S binding protein [Spirochaetia bacterium]MCF7952297.1 4Fe-4S binding protein [Spirochaetaceae bacterium]